jgi:hypothetical protein
LAPHTLIFAFLTGSVGGSLGLASLTGIGGPMAWALVSAVTLTSSAIAAVSLATVRDRERRAARRAALEPARRPYPVPGALEPAGGERVSRVAAARR